MGNRFPFTRIFFILFYVVILSINASVYSNNDPILITVPEPADFRSTLLLVKESGIAANSGKEVSAALERCLGSLNSENYDVCAQDILVVMPSLLKFFGQVNDATKAPRLDAPFIGDGAVSGCGSCCDLGQMLALLGLIKTEVNTIDQELIECCEAIAREFQETWTTLANLQITASVDFSPVFSVINECCNSTFSSLADIKTTLTACCATINSEFQQTWTILANLEISAVVDLSGVFTSVTACCNGTFSSLGAIIANQQTIISNEQATFTAISDVRNTLTACCATINSEFQQTWTILGALASNASGTFSSLAACCNGTFSVLSSIIANQQTIISNEQGTFTAISDVRNTLTACCATINSEFQQTWTILGELGSNASGTFTALAACCAATFSSLADIKNTLTICCATLQTLTAMQSCATTLITQAAVNAGGGQFTISATGIYVLAEDITSSGAGASGGVILINSSDVTLDLCSKRITGAAGNGSNGILVSPNISNVTIRNGVVETAGLSGVLVFGGVTDLFLERIYTNSCGLTGIVLIGNTALIGGTPAPILNSYIIECQANNCGIANAVRANYPISGLGKTVARDEQSKKSLKGMVSNRFTLFFIGGLSMFNCRNITVRNSKFCNNNSEQVFGCIAISCENCVFSDSLFNDNIGVVAIGLGIAGGSGNRIERCLANNNSQIGFNGRGLNRFTIGGANGFALDGSTNNVVVNCQASFNSGESIGAFDASSGANNSFDGCIAANNFGNGAGFNLNIETGTVIKNCQSIGNSSVSLNVDMAGFLSTDGTSNVFDGCIADNNSADFAAAGFRLSGEVQTTINNCVASNMVSTASTAYGILIEAVSGDGINSANNYIKGNKIATNTGVTIPGSYGIFDDLSPNSSDFVSGNFAFLNGQNYKVVYAGGPLPLVSGSLSGGMPATGTSGAFDNISIDL